MMRHSSSIGVGLGLLVVLPALASSRGGDTQDAALDGSLAKALDQTVRALAVLTGLEKDVAARPAPDAVQLARSVTESPLNGAEQRDETFARLRKDVSRLQMAYDDMELAGRTPGAPAIVEARSTTNTNTPAAIVSTGIDDALRAQLSSEPLLPRPRAEEKAASDTPTQTPATPEAIADELRRGQALYRAGRYKEALVVLRALSADVRARYWSARSLERLERTNEALELYQQVAADKTAGYLAERAKGDAEFLAWKQGFERKLEAENGAATRKAQDANAKKAANGDASAPDKSKSDTKPAQKPEAQPNTSKPGTSDAKPGTNSKPESNTKPAAHDAKPQTKPAAPAPGHGGAR